MMRPLLVFLCGAALLTTGCSEDEPIIEEESVVEAEENDESLSDELSTDVPPTTADYTPPFPEKIDFFSPPELDEPDVVVPTPGAQGDRGIRVLGFVQLEGEPRRVVIEVAGELCIAEAGDEVHGVKIVAVNDPDVTLQRGGRSWSLALFDQPLRDEMIAMNSEFQTERSGSRSSVQNSFLPGDDLDDEALALPDPADELPDLPADFE